MKLITYVNPASKLSCKRYNIAYNLGVPPSMFRWIKHLNLSQGVAAEVYDFHESKLFGCTPCGPPRKRTVNKFVARFRARWAVRRGRLRATDAVDPDLLRQKAVLLFRLQGLFL